MTTTLRQDAQALLDSSFTAYQIAKDTSVPVSTASDLKNGKQGLGNTTLAKVEELGEYWNESMGMYGVSTMWQDGGNITMTDEDVMYGDLYIQDAWDMIGSIIEDFAHGRVDGNRVDIAGGPSDMVSWVTVSLTGDHQGTYWFEDEAIKPFRETWLHKLSEWGFLTEE